MSSACAPIPEPQDPPIVQIHSPSGLWGCLPYIVGFQPAESLILVFMGPRPRRVVLTLRLDLDIDEDPTANAAIREMLITTLQRAKAHGVDIELVHIIASSECAAELPAAGVVLTTMLTADSCGLETGEMFASDGEYLWYYDEWSEDGGVGERHQLDMDEVDAARFALVTHGYGFAASRGELEVALEPHPDGTFSSAAWQKALARKHEGLRGSVRSQRLWRRVEEDHLVSALGRPRVDSDEALAVAPRWAAALTDAQIREPVMFRLLTEPPSEAQRRATALAREWLSAVTVRCPEAAVPPVAATLAAVSWQQGDGAFARIAAERALRADPNNSLGRLIAAASVSGLPPATWLNVLRAFGLEGLRRGSTRPRYPDLLPS
jgi:hypothetical protein